MKTWQIGIMVAKKDFCQEGENLVNRGLLPFMLHLAAHPLSYHVFACLLSLSCSCIHGIHYDRHSGATPYRVIESFATVTSCSSCVCLLSLSVTYLEILLIESLV